MHIISFVLYIFLMASFCFTSDVIASTPYQKPDSLRKSQKLTNVSDLFRGYTDDELDAAKRQFVEYTEPLTGKPVLRGVSVTGLVFLDINLNGKFDQEELPMSGIFVTDGLNIVLTGKDGRFSFNFSTNMEKHNRFVVMTTPTGFRNTNPFFISIGFDDEKISYTAEFGLTPDELSRREEFSFVNTSDSQFNQLEAMLAIEKDFAQMTAGDLAFLTVIGDLTATGSQYEFDMYKRITEASKIPIYNVLWRT